MIRREASVIGSDAGGSLVRFGPAGENSAACSRSCRGCGEAREVRLPILIGSDRVVVSTSEHLLPRALSNTLLLPLAGFVGGAALAGALGAGDPGSLVASVAGLVAGIAVCRRLPADSIHVEEVIHD